MTEINLKPFSSSSIKAGVELSLNTSTLTIIYSFTGDAFHNSLEKLKYAQRQDLLYQDTCFELFLKPKNKEHYYEYHFSLSGGLNAYLLNYYRSPLIPFSDDKFQKEVSLEILNDRSLKATVILPESQNSQDYIINLTAVYKEDESIQYFALSHREKANFHDFSLFKDLKDLI